MAAFPALGRQKQEDQKFKVIIRYVVSLGASWSTGGLYQLDGERERKEGWRERENENEREHIPTSICNLVYGLSSFSVFTGGPRFGFSIKSIADYTRKISSGNIYP